MSRIRSTAEISTRMQVVIDLLDPTQTGLPRRSNSLNGFADFYLKVKARIWP
jgi:hypothetical protein